MYYINLYEKGHFCTDIGGPIGTLPEAVAQVKEIAKTLQAAELKEYFGYTFDRAGSDCQIVVADRWHMPIRKEEDEA